MSSSVREATREDLPNIAPLLVFEMAREMPWLPDVDRLKVANKLHALIDNGKIFVLQHNGRIRGVLGIQRVEYWFSTEQFWQDVFFYVAPDARGYRAVRALIRAAEQVAPALAIGVFSALEPERKDKLMRRLGFDLHGGIYSKGIL